MRAYIAKCVLGVFAFDEKGRPIDHIHFTDGPAAMAKRYQSDADEAGLARRLASKGFDVVTSAKIEGFEQDANNKGAEVLYKDMLDMVVDLGFYPSKVEATKAIRDVGMALAGMELGRTKPGKDVQAAQATRAMDELDRVIEKLGQRIREWFLAINPDFRESMPGPESIEDKDDPKYHAVLTELHRKNLQLIGKSLSHMTKGDPTIDAMRALAEDMLQLFKDRDTIEAHVTETMKDIAPTLTEIAGPVIGARLISQAGSLHRLAIMSSTQVQLLGARKAVFRHIRHGGKPPKHGVLFLHPAVSGMPGHNRGKMAKALGSIVVRAARIDAFGGDRSRIKALKQELDDTVKRIKERRPPERKEAVKDSRKRLAKKGSRQRRAQRSRR